MENIQRKEKGEGGMMAYKIINANALHMPLPDKSVQMCVTSPPYYGLRDYGTAKWIGGDVECKHYVAGDGEYGETKAGLKQQTNTGSMRTAKNQCPKCGAIRQDSQIGLEQTPDEYVSKLVQVFREVWRVMKDDGVLWLNLGDSYAGSNNGSNDYRGNESSLSKNNNKYGTHKPGSGNLKPKDLIGIPWRVAFALQADGWYLRQDIIWHKPNPMPESVKDRCTKSHEYIFLLSKQARYYYDYKAILEPAAYDGRKDTVFKGSAKFQGGSSNGLIDPGRQKERWPNTIRGFKTKDQIKDDQHHGNDISYNEQGGIPARNKRSVWTVPTKGYPGAHFATFPPDLIIDCIKAGSRPGDTVLDPFNGSGTTGEVCERFGRDYVGIELNREYLILSEERLKPFRLQPNLI